MQIALNENVYVHEETKQLIYRKSRPIDPKFVKFIEKRKMAEYIEKFDKEFKESLSISHEEWESANNIWDVFMDKILMTNSFIFYSANYLRYLVNVFKNFIDEGIMHIEARALLGSVLNEVYFLE